MPLPGPAANRHAIQLDRFLDAQDGKAAVEVTMSDIRRTYDLMTSVYKAAATGQAVERGSITPSDPYYQQFAGISAART